MRPAITAVFSEMFLGTKNALATKRDITLLALLSMIFFAGMFALPVYNVPGNSFLFQATIYHWTEYLMLILLSLLSALSLALQWTAFRAKRVSGKETARQTLLGGGGIVTGIISSLFVSASCATCLGALFSFIGFNTLIFLAVHRWYILGGALALILVSIYFAARKINRGCEVCVID
jgi:protein-S-isoprenylcysteine O-methyltransferase Ste14